MVLITCVDQKNGLGFNGRRQTSDSAVYADICKYAEDHFCGIDMASDTMLALENYLKLTGQEEHPLFTEPKEARFAELDDCKGLDDIYEMLILYRWDKTYPADIRLEIGMQNYALVEQHEMVGSSHKKIVREVYQHI
ncbi:MAG: hypothetical protein J5851_01450 [Oscillospiraceae bacterium]|nr:hypothetical protein [Oscillospiraceae bacterium]